MEPKKQTDSLPGKQWIPSNGSVGDSFIDDNCGNCERDVGNDCKILAASFRGEAVEWRSTAQGVFCTAFVKRGQPIPEPRCKYTIDMFSNEASA